MNTSPLTSWQEFTAENTGAIYTFADRPGIIIALCAVCLLLVGWFIVSAYRFEGRGRDDAS